MPCLPCSDNLWEQFAVFHKKKWVKLICCLLKKVTDTSGHDGCSPFSQNERIAPTQACLAVELHPDQKPSVRLNYVSS